MSSEVSSGGVGGISHPKRLRTVFCTRGGLFGASVLERLQACERIEICGVVRSSRVFHPSLGTIRGSLALIRRSGLAYALYMLCATTLADLLCIFGRVGGVPFRTRPRGVRVHTTANVNDAAGLRFLRECTPDLIVSAFFDQRLHEAALSVPRRACVNIHPSLLPALKGVDPMLQARLQNVYPVGATVHYMVPTLDAGHIIVQRAADVPEGASVFEGTAILYASGAELLVGEIGRIERGESGVAQSTPGSYQSWPTRAEVRSLRALRSVLIRLTDFGRVLAWRPSGRLASHTGAGESHRS